MKRLLITLFAVLAATGASAQQRTWTLADCVRHALENNLSVQQSGITVEQRDVALNTARNRRLPGVSGSASQNFSFGRGLTADNTYANTNTTNTSFSLGGEIPVFQGFQITNNIALSRLDLQAATADLEKAKDDISVAVAQAYVQILYDQEILDVAQNQVAIDSLQVARLRELARTGKASSADVSAQEASLAQSRLSATQAAGNLRLAVLELTQLLELPSPDGFAVARPDPAALAPGLLMNPEQIYADAVSTKARVRAEELRLDYADLNIRQAKAAYLPTLSLSGGLGTNYYTSSGYPHKNFHDQLTNNFSQYIGLSLNVPIFSRFSTRNSVRTAELSRRNQELQLESVKKSLYKEIQQAYYNAVNSQKKLESSEAAARSAADAFALMSAKYEGGKANITEFNESKNRYLEAESNFLQARYEYLYQTKILDFYRGIQLDF